MAQRKLEATILGIEVKVVNRKSDNQEITLYEVGTDKGTYTTSRREVAEEAWNHRNEPMLLTVEETESGLNPHTNRPYQNKYLQAVEIPVSGQSLVSPASQFPEPVGERGGFGNLEPANTAANTTGARPGLSGYEKDVNIMRQTATKAAGAFSKTPDEFKSNVDACMYFYESGTWPDAAQNAIQQTPDTSGGAEPFPSLPNPDDDIPF